MVPSAQLASLLRELEIPQYLQSLTDAGFDGFQALVGITEDDFEALQVKRGHRRKLQQAIRRILEHASVGSSASASKAICFEEADGAATVSVGRDDMHNGHPRRKRRYTRRPRPDSNAPTRPLSAYVLFANHIRKEPASQSLSFTDMARLVGERWQALPKDQRKIWESPALEAKTSFAKAAAAYSTTESCRRYQEYLARFQQATQGSSDADDQSIPSGDSPDDPPGGPLGTEHPCGVFGSGRNNSLILGYQYGHLSTTDRELPVSKILSKPAFSSQTDAVSLGANTLRKSMPIPRPTLDPLEQTEAQWREDLPTSIDMPESLIKEVHKLLLQDRGKVSTRHNAPKATPNMAQESEIQGLNPFAYYDRAEMDPYIESFLSRFNSLLYWFDEEALLDDFRRACNSALKLPKQVMFEICMVLSIGCQFCDKGLEGTSIMWYENGRRFLDDSNWKNDLWVMRGLCLISVYHIRERVDTSRHYLGLAIQVAKASRLLDSSGQLPEMEREERWHWLRVWDSMLFLHSWLAVTTRSKFIEFSSHNFPTDIYVSSPISPDQFSNRTTQMNMALLGLTLRSILRDGHGKPSDPIQCRKDRLRDLDNWTTNLPDEFLSIDLAKKLQRGPQVPYEEMYEGQKNGVLGLNVMYLGFVILLTRPNLLQIVASSPQHNGQYSLASTTTEQAAEEEEEEACANRCITSAFELIGLCVAFINVGTFPQNAWIYSHFLFEASLVVIRALIPDIEEDYFYQSPSPHSRPQRQTSGSRSEAWIWPSSTEGIAMVRDAQRVLDYCAQRDKGGSTTYAMELREVWERVARRIG